MGENAVKPPRRWYRKKRYLIPLIMLGIALFLHLPNRPVKIQVGPDTTVIDGPLGPDDVVDYTAYLDNECSLGVTADNNAAPLLIKAVGESLLDPAQWKILHRLRLPEDWLVQGPHFVAWDYRPELGAEYKRKRREEEVASILAGDQKYDKAADVVATQPELAASLAAVLSACEDAESPKLDDVIKMLDRGDIHPDLAPWLDRNAEALDLVCQASLKPRYYLPLVSLSGPPELINLFRSSLCIPRGFAGALCARARLRCRSGEFGSAWDDLLAVHRLARLQQQQPFLLSSMLAATIEMNGFQAAKALIARTGQDPDRELRALRDMQALEPLNNIARAVACGERFYVCDAIAALSQGRVSMEELAQWPSRPHSRVRSVANLDWNEMLRVNNRWYDQMLAALELPPSPARRQALNDFGRRMTAWLTPEPPTAGQITLYRLGGWPTRRLLSREVARAVAAYLIPDVKKVAETHDAARMAFEVEKTALALACHKARHGRRPARLDELVGDLLKEVPADVFSGKPLVYRPEGEGYVLYSVGINGRDDGGEKDDSSYGEKTPDDIAVRVPAGAK